MKPIPPTAPPPDRFRRGFLAWPVVLGLSLFACPLRALPPIPPEDDAAEEAPPRLDARQSQAVRAWIVRIAEAQIRAPSPRWTQRDCAGLVRFAVAEALAEHDARWRRSMGLHHRLPPDLVPAAARERLRNRWRRPDGSRGAYADAISLAQENSRPRGRDVHLLQPADLLFFDQGDDQHLMLWTGRRVVYHNGAPPTPQDDGLRAATLAALLAWRDTRWRPEPGNPNFAGVFSLVFLS
ncbi:MAG: DUF1175 domain-containing protein [Candidatus Accumulibacter sp.]|jgi:uncharacterized protein YfaT (DUF1175 family)|nr:DUF1175 domain-containing protein [Accumulibacter sp.]